MDNKDIPAALSELFTLSKTKVVVDDEIGCAYKDYEYWEKFISNWLSKQNDPNNYDDNFEAWWEDSSILDRIPLYALMCDFVAQNKR